MHDRGAVSAPVPASVLRRTLVSVAIGGAAALLTLVLVARPHFWPDSLWFWTTAKLLRVGIDPYRAFPGGLPEPFQSPFLYPLPAALPYLPVSGLTFPHAAAVMAGFGAGLFALAMQRHRPAFGLWACAGAPFLLAINTGQWSPWIVAGAIFAPVAWASAVKPTLGLALWLSRPQWAPVVWGVGVGTATLILLPTWPREWLRAVAFVPQHPVPILTPLGCVVLLALFRWRDPDARLVLALACVPQLWFFADQLPLILVARTKREMLTLTLSSLLALCAWAVFHDHTQLPTATMPPFAFLGCYLPALAVVLLRRPVRQEEHDRVAAALNEPERIA